MHTCTYHDCPGAAGLELELLNKLEKGWRVSMSTAKQ
jgi:hypothetical protein